MGARKPRTGCTTCGGHTGGHISGYCSDVCLAVDAPDPLLPPIHVGRGLPPVNLFTLFDRVPVILPPLKD